MGAKHALLPLFFFFLIFSASSTNTYIKKVVSSKSTNPNFPKVTFCGDEHVGLASQEVTKKQQESIRNFSKKKRAKLVVEDMGSPPSRNLFPHDSEYANNLDQHLKRTFSRENKLLKKHKNSGNHSVVDGVTPLWGLSKRTKQQNKKRHRAENIEFRHTLPSPTYCSQTTSKNRKTTVITSKDKQLPSFREVLNPVQRKCKKMEKIFLQPLYLSPQRLLRKIHLI